MSGFDRSECDFLSPFFSDCTDFDVNRTRRLGLKELVPLRKSGSAP